MPKFLAPVDFEVWCACGEGLCVHSHTVNDGEKVWEDEYSNGPAVIVEPCPRCCKKKTTKKERAKGG